MSTIDGLLVCLQKNSKSRFVDYIAGNQAVILFKIMFENLIKNLIKAYKTGKATSKSGEQNTQKGILGSISRDPFHSFHAKIIFQRLLIHPLRGLCRPTNTGAKLKVLIWANIPSKLATNLTYLNLQESIATKCASWDLASNLTPSRLLDVCELILGAR